MCKNQEMLHHLSSPNPYTMRPAKLNALYIVHFGLAQQGAFNFTTF
jgi:hypothetical protein